MIIDKLKHADSTKPAFQQINVPFDAILKGATMADKPLTKTQILNELSERSGVAKKDVSEVLEKLEALIEEALGKKGPGAFTLPGLMKISIKTVKARPARMGRNPQTGEEMMIPAKKASKKVKVTALKKLKEMV
ncbi:HU family DNA-binding protein [Planctomicrobium sp. SH661]|uniref:HU family DNA-binding protein n=1 Tax=Planctomicrobium sp. SH661 TaxID=3448124 RepID=UPI003F5C2638